MKRILTSCLIGVLLTYTVLAKPAYAEVQVIFGENDRRDEFEQQRDRFERQRDRRDRFERQRDRRDRFERQRDQRDQRDYRRY